MALQTLLHFWTQLPFGGRSDACGVCVCVLCVVCCVLCVVCCVLCVCVCGELQAFCIFGLNCLLAGRSDALRAMTFTGTKLSWICFLLRGAR